MMQIWSVYNNQIILFNIQTKYSASIFTYCNDLFMHHEMSIFNLKGEYDDGICTVDTSFLCK